MEVVNRDSLGNQSESHDDAVQDLKPLHNFLEGNFLPNEDVDLGYEALGLPFEKAFLEFLLLNKSEFYKVLKSLPPSPPEKSISFLHLSFKELFKVPLHINPLPKIVIHELGFGKAISVPIFQALSNAIQTVVESVPQQLNNLNLDEVDVFLSTSFIAAMNPVDVPSFFQPTAVDDFASVNKNRIVVGNLLANDLISGGDTVMVSQINGLPFTSGQIQKLASGALLTVFSNGDFVFDPASSPFLQQQVMPGQPYDQFFTYTLQDTQGFTSSALVQVQVTGGVGDLTAAFDTKGTDKNVILNVPAFAGLLVINVPGVFVVGTLNLSNQFVLSSPVLIESGALVQTNPDGSYTYNPNGAFDYLMPGDPPVYDNFVYKITNGIDRSSAGQITVIIAPSLLLADNEIAWEETETFNHFPMDALMPPLDYWPETFALGA